MKSGPVFYLVEPVCPFCAQKYRDFCHVEAHLNAGRCAVSPGAKPGECQTCEGVDSRAPGPKYVYCVKCRPVRVVMGVVHGLETFEAGGDIILAELLRQAGPCDGKHGPMGCRRELVKESYRLGRERAIPEILGAIRP